MNTLRVSHTRIKSQVKEFVACVVGVTRVLAWQNPVNPHLDGVATMLVGDEVVLKEVVIIEIITKIRANKAKDSNTLHSPTSQIRIKIAVHRSKVHDLVTKCFRWDRV